MIDASELDSLAADMDRANKETLAKIAKVNAKGGLNVKNGARQRVEGHSHLPLYPASIGYQTTVRAGSVETEIGPDKDKAQGSLGNLIEYGSSKNAPMPHLGPELDLEAPRYESAVLDAAEVW